MCSRRAIEEAFANRTARGFWDVDENAFVLRGPVDEAAEPERAPKLKMDTFKVLLERTWFYG